jgi:hypothetical protein
MSQYFACRAVLQKIYEVIFELNISAYKLIKVIQQLWYAGNTKLTGNT